MGISNLAYLHVSAAVFTILRTATVTRSNRARWAKHLIASMISSTMDPATLLMDRFALETV